MISQGVLGLIIACSFAASIVFWFVSKKLRKMAEKIENEEKER